MNALRLWALALLLAAALPLWAQELVPVPALNARVMDQTSTLTPAQRSALEDKLAGIERERGTQIVVLMLATTKPEDIADYTQRLGDAWKLGRREVGDGLLIVVAKDDRRMRIAPAKALEGAIPDLAASRIIEERMAPAFRQGDYAGGLNAAIDRLAERIGSEGLPEPTARRAPSSGQGFDWEDGLLFLLVGVPLVGGVAVSIFGRKLGSLATGGAVGAIGWWLTTSTLVGIGAGVMALFLVGVMGVGGRGGRGGGMPIIWGGGGGHGGGGGFGGFGSGGGGDFGGGGASGDW
ncbi:MAG: TPM domain-containing protein [Rhizobacter sp.]